MCQMPNLSRAVECALVVSFACSSILLGMLLGYFGHFDCLHSKCIEKSELMSENMDYEVDPCKHLDFFACGNALKNKDSTVIVNNMLKDIEKQVDLFINSVFNNITVENFLQFNIASFLSNCNNLYIKNKQYEAQSVKTVLRLILDCCVFYDIFNKASLEDDGFSFDIGSYEQKSLTSGLPGQSLFSYKFVRSTKRPSKVLTVIGLPAFDLIDPERYGSLGDMPQQFITHAFKFLFGQDLDENIKFAIISFAKKIAKLVLENTNSSVNGTFVTVHKLNKIFPHVQWRKFWSKILLPNSKLPNKVYLAQKKYFVDLNELLNKTPRKLIALYMLYHDIEGIVYWMKTEETADKFFEKYYDAKKFCVKVCNNFFQKYFGPALTSLIIERFSIKNGGRQALDDIVPSIVLSIKNSIKKRTWIDEKSKENVIKKLDGLKVSLSVSDAQFETLSNSNYRMNYYSSLCMKNTSLVDQILQYNKFYMKKRSELFQREMSGYDETIAINYARVHYEQSTNHLIVPIGLLQFPVFDKDFSWALNYAGIGVAIAHELGIHFAPPSPENRRIDDLKHNMWSNTSLDEFDKLLEKCSEDKAVYNEEVGALKISFEAYMILLKEKEIRERYLVTMSEYTHKETFFIAYTNLYCPLLEKNYGEVLFNHLHENKEIIYIISNLKIFKNAFKCTANLKRNKLYKHCPIW